MESAPPMELNVLSVKENSSLLPPHSYLKSEARFARLRVVLPAGASGLTIKNPLRRLPQDGVKMQESGIGITPHSSLLPPNSFSNARVGGTSKKKGWKTMKKNKMMRFASLVLVLTLLSTCAISGTFAKYVTTSSGGDNARVAIWDITADFVGADTDGDMLFKAVYGDTVDSNDDDQVVAPGTNDSYTYSMIGAPEVDYVVSFAFDSAPTDVTLYSGVYTFAAPYQDMTVTATNNYLPLKWSVTISTTNGTLSDTATTVFTADAAREFASLADIKTALSTVTVAFDANETCDVDVTIAWSWDFEATNAYTDYDKMDTVLGYYVQRAEDSTFTLPFATTVNNAITNIAYDFSMTATQVD